MWSEKHRPKTIEEMIGNDDARLKLVSWLKKWKPGGRAVILVGPPGTGKTTSVHLAAKKLGMQLVELNASDARTRERLSKKVGEVIHSTSLTGEKTLVFLDEVDGLAGRADYGAIDFIKDAVRHTENPVVMAANDPDSDEVRKLASVTNKVEYRRLSPEELTVHLTSIAKDEGQEPGKEMLRAIVAAANGDVRSAINFLQAGQGATKDEALTASQALNEFFDAMDEESALKALRDYPGQPRDKMRELFSSVVRARIHEERKAEALDVLSRADLIMGRIMRGKDWRLLRYLDPMLAAELWRVVGDGGASYSPEAVPWPLQVRIWNDSRKLKELGLLIGRRLWISGKESLVEDVPYVLLLSKDRGFREELVNSLDLEENYAAFIAKESARGTAR